MFQDALVESSGMLRTRARYWMLATLAFNLLIVVTLNLVPLLYPEALPRNALTATLIAPAPPRAAAAPPARHVAAVHAVAPLSAMVAPSRVPHRIELSRESPPPELSSNGITGGVMQSAAGRADGVTDAIALANNPIVVAARPEHPKLSGPLHVSSGVAVGALLVKTAPVYPAIAKTARVSGAVVLHATISTVGTIESLQVISGPEMLRSSALDAVRQWRYRPYLLNNEPTAVETTVTVNFSFGG